MIEYFVPPIVGAVIGYFTNDVAIKMLFRPLKAYYLFGWRVPFTPGLIPSKRGKLAEAIAKVIKENLLTEEVLRKRLNEERIKDNLRKLVKRLLDEFLRSGNGYIEDFLENVGDERLEFLVNFNFVEDKLADVIDKFFEFLRDKRVEELLTPSLKKEMEKIIDEKIDEITEEILNLTKKSEFRDIVYYGVRKNLRRFMTYFPLLKEKALSSFSERISDMIINFIENSASDPQFKTKVSKVVWEKTRELLNRKINLSGERGETVKSIVKNSLFEVIDSYRGKRVSEISGLKNEIVPQLTTLLKEVVQKKKGYISGIATDKLLQVIEIELPVIMASLDVETLVKDRIDSLPIEDVEAMVLRIIKEELRYITLLGGVLGFLIGGLQVIFFGILV